VTEKSLAYQSAIESASGNPLGPKLKLRLQHNSKHSVSICQLHFLERTSHCAGKFDQRIKILCDFTRALRSL